VFCSSTAISTGTQQAETSLCMATTNQTKNLGIKKKFSRCKAISKVDFFRMLEQACDMFSFEDCHFAIQKHKETCGRIVMFREFNLINSFTIEVSFMGANRGVLNGLHFNPNHI
jgi:hypothetical protein